MSRKKSSELSRHVMLLGAERIKVHFSVLKDRRRRGEQFKYPLVSLIAIAMLADISGFDGWDQIELFAEERYDWLREFLDLPEEQSPSDDTFRRVFGALNARAFGECVFKWLMDLVDSVEGTTIALDGKALRRAFDRARGLSALYLVHAYVVEYGVLIGQQVTSAKSNEIPADAKLLERIEIKGTTVTMDAMGTQRAHTKLIVEREGDYVLAVKDNQPKLLAAIEAAFADAKEPTVYPQIEHGHGRIESRATSVLAATHARIPMCEQWCGLKSIVRVERTRAVGDEPESAETHYFISSHSSSRRQRIERAVRAHWGVENQLHWCLDVTFREDESRVRDRTAAENLALIRRLALSLLRNDASRKRKTSIRSKRLIAAMNPSYALRVLLTPFVAKTRASS